jgi:hypothetical protein
LNLIPLEKGLTFKLSKAEQQVRMIIEMTVADSGVSYLDGSSCRDDLSFSILQGLCDVLDERVEKHFRILHMELGQDRLLLK